MKSSFFRAGFLALASIVAVAVPALADTVQGFTCDSRGSVSFRNPTSHDKKFVIQSIDKVAELVDAGSSGPVGIVYNVDPPQPFTNITWYYKQAANSNALSGITVRYCVQAQDGTQQQSFDIAGGASNRGGSVGDGWSDTVQDTRVFPSIVKSGNAYLSKLTFIFKNDTNNITLGKVVINPGSINPSLITDIGSCNLSEPCREAVNSQ